MTSASYRVLQPSLPPSSFRHPCYRPMISFFRGSSLRGLWRSLSNWGLRFLHRWTLLGRLFDSANNSLGGGVGQHGSGADHQITNHVRTTVSPASSPVWSSFQCPWAPSVMSLRQTIAQFTVKGLISLKSRLIRRAMIPRRQQTAAYPSSRGNPTRRERCVVRQRDARLGRPKRIGDDSLLAIKSPITTLCIQHVPFFA